MLHDATRKSAFTNKNANDNDDNCLNNTEIEVTI